MYNILCVFPGRGRVNESKILRGAQGVKVWEPLDIGIPGHNFLPRGRPTSFVMTGN
jgi:hypothetical protein